MSSAITLPWPTPLPPMRLLAVVILMPPAVPAGPPPMMAMRMALPQADPGLYLALSLGVTFPFNILIGIPLFAAIAGWLGGN